MNNINDLFNERDSIIESMGYFNPLILEENNVVLTEGVVGGLVEKIQALWKMIKGWITKLIDFVSSKFKRTSTGKIKNISKSVDENNKRLTTMVNDMQNDINKRLEKNKNFINNLDNISNAIQKDLDESEKKSIQKQIETAKNNIKVTRDVFSRYPGLIEKKQQELEELKNKSKGAAFSQIKLPELENAKKAVNNIINDCKKAITANDPYESFKGKSLKVYFEKSKEKTLTVANFLSNESYKSYTNEAGNDCVDQLRGYQKALDAAYKQLESMAEHVTDKERSNQILNKAKGINRITQNVLKGTVTILSHYVTKLTDLRTSLESNKTDISKEIEKANSDLEKMKQSMPSYNRAIAGYAKQIRNLENKLK